MPLGRRDTSDLVLLTGWDATALQKFELEDGTTYDVIVARMNAALAGLNAELVGDSLWSGMMSYTDQPDLEYRVGVSNGFEDFSEYGRADAKRADTEGHMLPLRPFDRKLGWTWSYLREARMAHIEADLADAIKDARDKWRVPVLTRFLQRGDDSGERNKLGSTGLSTGFATDEGSTGVDFRPPDYQGTSFDNTHEHYIGIAGGVFTNAVFQDARDELREHGHAAPYTCLIGTADRAAVIALTNFTKAAEMTVRTGITQDIALPNTTVNSLFAEFLGVIENIEVYEVRGVPQYYGIIYKSYGPRSQRNPLRVRVAKGQSLPRVIAMPDPRASNGSDPLQNLMLFLEFGVGVAERTGATPRYVNNATWADGTPT